MDRPPEIPCYPSGMPARRKRLRCFPPVLRRDTHILVLGSFPGEASLAAGEYYAHPRNQFWRLMGALLSEPLEGRPYRDRITALLDHRIGLWDVIAACERSGSLDGSIRNPALNDFLPLRALAPGIRRVGFNGRTSGRLADLFRAAGYDTLVLPSSSPAYASLSFGEKLKAWRRLLRRRV